MSTLAATQSLSGVYPVGSTPGNNLKTVTVKFNTTFGAVPVVTANTIGDPGWPNINDTFAVSIVAVNGSGFTANIYRVDNILNVPKGGQGWMQKLQLGWTAQVQMI